jgi:glycosyltransferase involved in cell wall biosynthesis
MKRVLVVAYYFPPLGGIGSVRTARMAEHLGRYGWCPTVLAPRDGAYYRDETLSTSIEVIRTRSIELSRAGKQMLRTGGTDTQEADVSGAKALLKHFARRYFYFPDAQVGWMAPALLEARLRIGRGDFDAVYSTSFPITTHLVARRIARRLGIPWVAEYRDPWSQMLPHDSPILARSQRLEQVIARDASALVTVSPSWAIMFEEAWGRPVAVVRNGHDGPPADAPADEHRFTLAYLGTYYPDTQDLTSLWRAIGAMPASAVDGVQIIGDAGPALLAEINSAGIGRLVKSTGFIPHGAALSELMRASALIVAGPKDDRPVLRGQVAAKLSEYLATGKPIVYVGNPDADAAALLAEYPGTYIAATDDVQGVADALRAARSEAFVRDASDLARSALAGQLAAVLDRVCS